MKAFRQPGLTIIELLVTISIIALLVAAAGIGIARTRLTGRDAKRVADALLISRAMDETAASLRGAYPQSATTANNGTILINKNTNDTSFSKPLNRSAFSGASFPSDPSPYSTTCPSGPDYVCGYTLVTRNVPAGGSNLAKWNSATERQYEYAVTVGLEGEGFRDAQEFNLADTTRAGGKRKEYVLFGKACGVGLTQNTCSLL